MTGYFGTYLLFAPNNSIVVESYGKPSVASKIVGSFYSCEEYPERKLAGCTIESRSDSGWECKRPFEGKDAPGVNPWELH